MRRYIIVDNASGNVLQTHQWGDDRDFPSNIEIKESETLVTVGAEECIDLCNTYDFTSNQFYVLDIDDNSLEISILKEELGNYDSILSDFQEETWRVMGIDESKLESIWQERLAYKRDLRNRILMLGGVV